MDKEISMASLCQNCGGPLIYSPEISRLTCKMCGASYRPEDVEDYGKESHVYDCRVYTCGHCGGEIIINGTEASTMCIYCGNPNVVFKRVSKERRPDGIIPFTISRERARELLTEKLNSGRFIPSDIRKAEIKDITGVYIPYWVVDCDFNDAVLYQSVADNGKNSDVEYHGTYINCFVRSLALDGATRLNDNVCNKLEPFFFEDVKPFNEDYLNGFYSDTTDLTPSDLREAVLGRCDTMYREYAVGEIPGRDKKVLRSQPSVNIRDGAVYIMFPAWFCSFTFKGEHHTFLVNGQTGKVVGAVPFDKRKANAIGAALFLTFLALFLLPLFLMHHSGYQLRAAAVNLTLYAIPVMMFIGAPILGIAFKKIKRLWDSIENTRSGSIFLYAKKRQGA